MAVEQQILINKEQFIQYCKGRAVVSEELELKALDNIGHGDSFSGSFGAVAYFHQQAAMFQYEIPNLVERYCEEAQVTAADVVEVVRCGECKSWCPISNGKAGTCKGKVQGVTKPDDFCSRGERRTDNGR